MAVSVPVAPAALVGCAAVSDQLRVAAPAAELRCPRTLSRLRLFINVPAKPLNYGFGGWKGMRPQRFHCFSESANDKSSDTSDDAPETTAQTAQVNLNLPRRRLLAEFTCNACNVRTQRLINPAAYKRGTVFVQCAGCEVYHQLVDNLGLIVEFKYEAEACIDEKASTELNHETEACNDEKGSTDLNYETEHLPEDAPEIG